MPRVRPTSLVRKQIRESANSRILDFLGPRESLQTVERQLPPHEIPNCQILGKQFFEREISGATLHGTRRPGNTIFDEPHGFSDLLEDARADKDGDFEGIQITNLRYVKPVPESVDSRLGLGSALVFFTYEGAPLVAYFWTQTRITKSCAIGLICTDVPTANRLINSFVEYLNINSIFRRKTLLPNISYSSEIDGLLIVEYQRVFMEDLVLPDELKSGIRENIIDFNRHERIIRANGFEMKRGILFHGVPGTGKSLACRMIASELTDFTTILMTGEDQRRPKVAFALARRLQPALIIFEDIDNIGIKREDNEFRSVLSDLMNELDGLGERENVYVLFTTNHIEYLEQALVERQGRVDLVFEFPLPTAPLRRKLIRLYARKAIVAVSNFNYILERTEGTSPAFIKELVKLALLHAIRRGATDTDDIASLTESDFHAALDQLGSITNASAKKIIGFVDRVAETVA